MLWGYLALLVWGHFDRQADASEFLHHMLEWADPKHVDLCWTRRVQLPEGVMVCDRGSRNLPPMLQPLEREKDSSLQDMITAWHEYQGMHTCFKVDTPMLGLQIDQYHPTHQGAARMPVPLHIPDKVFLPFWSDETTMAVYHREYHPVAVILHRGQDQAGHVQSGLLSDEGWFLTDDAYPAHNDDPLLTTRLTDVVFIWLVRSDIYQPTPVAQPQWGRDAIASGHAICAQERLGWSASQ